MPERRGRLAGFEVYRGKGRRARRLRTSKGGLVFNLYMAWLRRGTARVKEAKPSLIP